MTFPCGDGRSQRSVLSVHACRAPVLSRPSRLSTVACVIAATTAIMPGLALSQTIELPTVTIFGASTVPVDAPRVGASVSVITAQDLQSRGVTTLPDALRTIPGVAVSQQGNRGGLTQVRVRGAEANHTLVVVDGVPINDPTDGDANLSNLPVDAIERIEVIRGPQSGIWGPNAHAGVINIITRSGRGLERPEVTARIEGGSFGTVQGSASVRGSLGRAYGALTVNGMRTDGTVVADRFGTQARGAQSAGATARFGIDVTEWFNVDGSLRVQNRQNGYAPADYTSFGPTYGFLVDGRGQSNMTDQQGRLAATFRMLEGRWTHRFSVDTALQNRNSADAYMNDQGSLERQSSWFRTERTRGEYRTAFTFETTGARHTLVAGADAVRERMRLYYESDGAWGPFVVNSNVNGRTRDRHGLYGEYLLALDSGFSLSAALRHDWNSTFRDATTWRVTVAQTFDTGTKLRASIGRGVTNPSFIEQFGFSGTFIGNPFIRPESSIGWDIGVDQQVLGNRLVLGLTYFRANLTDEIVGSGNSVANSPVGTSRQGIEATLTARPVDWLTIVGGYTYTDSRSAEVVGNQAVFKEALRRPRHAGSLSATASFADNRGRFTVTAAHNGAMRDRFFGTWPPSDVFLRSYTLVSAQLAYDVTRNATAFLRGENIFGQRHQEVFDYRGPGAAIYAGLRVKLD